MSADPPTASRSRPAGPAGEPGGLLLTGGQARRAVALLDAAARFWGPGQPGRAGRARAPAAALTHQPARLDAAQARALPHLLRDGARWRERAGDPGWLLDGFTLAAQLERATRERAPTPTPERAPAARAGAPPGAHRQPTARADRARSTPISADPTRPTGTPRQDPDWMDDFDRQVIAEVGALPPIRPVVALTPEEARALAYTLTFAGFARKQTETNHTPAACQHAQTWKLLGLELDQRASAAVRRARQATSERNRAYIQRAYATRAQRPRVGEQAEAGRQRPGREEADRDR
jgi:hypothetical protein